MSTVECPPWCERHDVVDIGTWRHVRTLLAYDDLSIELSLYGLFEGEAGDGVHVEILAPGLAIDLPATPELLRAFTGAVAAATWI